MMISLLLALIRQFPGITDTVTGIIGTGIAVIGIVDGIRIMDTMVIIRPIRIATTMDRGSQSTSTNLDKLN